MWGSPLPFSSWSRFLCLLQPCSRWACQQQQRKICDLNLRLEVVYCWVYSGITAFSSLFNTLLAVGWLKVSLSKWKLFLLCSLFPLPQTHGHLAYAVCSLCRDCQHANKARVDMHGQSRHDGCELSQTAGHSVKNSDQMVSLTKLTTWTVDLSCIDTEKNSSNSQVSFQCLHCWKTIP